MTPRDLSTAVHALELQPGRRYVLSEPVEVWPAPLLWRPVRAQECRVPEVEGSWGSILTGLCAPSVFACGEDGAFIHSAPDGRALLPGRWFPESDPVYRRVPVMYPGRRELAIGARVFEHGLVWYALRGGGYVRTTALAYVAIQDVGTLPGSPQAEEGDWTTGSESKSA